MIEISNLTKIYERNKNNVIALNNVSFSLPDKGFVFVVGKSGCGKSTLLNLLGGLDSITEGEIVCDGNYLSKLSNAEFDDYRNEYLGFVFQDFCLLESLTVLQNIEIALKIKGEPLSLEQTEKLVDNALSQVALSPSIKNRLVKELSGGQKQRVSIARALVKNPKLILADEPTGNLDSKTSLKILKLLQNLSNDRLVVIVSHNLHDAQTFADQIIELADGKIVDNLSRTRTNSDDKLLSENTLALPYKRPLTPEEVQEVNDNLKEGKINKIVQRDSGFKRTENITPTSTPVKVDLQCSKMSIKDTFNVSAMFLKKRVAASIFTVLIVSALVFLLGMCQFFVQFDVAESISLIMHKNGEETIYLRKGFLDDENLNLYSYIFFDDDEINDFYNHGYTGNIFKVLQIPMTTYLNNSEAYLNNMAAGIQVDKIYPFNWIFTKESYGTAVCTREYLEKTFGVDGELQILAGDLTDKSYGVVIPDFIADGILYENSEITSYQSIVGRYIDQLYVNAIFKTDYAKKYNDLFNYLIDVGNGVNRVSEKKYYEKQFKYFCKSILTRYGLCYSINPNFEADFLTYNQFKYTFCNYCEFQSAINNSAVSVGGMLFVKASEYNLKDNEIAIPYTTYNSIFGDYLGYQTEESYEAFSPVTFTFNGLEGDFSTRRFSIDITISKLLPANYFEESEKNEKIAIVNESTFNLLNAYNYGAFSLIIEDVSQLSSIYNVLIKDNYDLESTTFDSTRIIGNIVNIFHDLFGLILFVVAGACLITLVNYAYGNIRKCYYEIGVFKSLGAKTSNIWLIFSMQTILAGLSVLLISNVLLLTLCGPINAQLSNSLVSFVKNGELGVVRVFNVNAQTLIINAVIILLITVISCLIPILKLNKIKPRNIISSKD